MSDLSPQSSSDYKKLLAEPFPPQVLGSLNKGGRRLTYVPITEVIVRLNDVLGIENWHTEVMKLWRDEVELDWCLAHVRIIANVIGPDGLSHSVQKEQVGGQKIKRTNSGEAIDIGDEYKGAISDAIKKCAQQLGVGLELSRKEEALRWESNRDAAAEMEMAQAQLAEDISEIKAVIDSLIPRAKDQFRVWWKDNNLPKPDDLTVDHGIDLVKKALAMFVENQKKWLATHPEDDPNRQRSSTEPPEPGYTQGPSQSPDQPSYTPEEELRAVDLATSAFPGSSLLGIDEEPF